MSPPRTRRDGLFAGWILLSGYCSPVPAATFVTMNSRIRPTTRRPSSSRAKWPVFQQVELRVRQVSQVGVGSFGREDGIVLSPDDERGWQMGAEVPLPPWI